MTFAILATGPSMSQAVADSVRHLRVVAVSDAFVFAPWAEALASQDLAWWKARPLASDFRGRKFCGAMEPPEGVALLPDLPSGCNSGVLGIRVARHLGAKRIVLLGFDGHGTHFFGPHTGTLKETTELRRRAHFEQHRQEAHACQWHGVEVWNCTPGTVIDAYPTTTLQMALQSSKVRECAPG